MKERPILFSGPMVRAILDGRKTQTRRVAKSQPHADVGAIRVEHYHPTIIDRLGDDAPGPEIFGAYSEDGLWGCKCPYGQPGDRLWVRETWNWEKNAIGAARDEDGPFAYAAGLASGSSIDGKWRPSIHMPRWASRITLEITGVRVERLQHISEVDAIAEGIERHYNGWRPYTTIFYEEDGVTPANYLRDPRESYRQLWNSLNVAHGFGWDVNPWIWVVEFRRLER
jgi:hypothetical protein